MTDAVSQATILLARGRVGDAVALVARAAEAHDPAALFQHAVWKLTGHPVPRDLAGARTLLRRATERGHSDAALMEVALTANGSGAPSDWAAAATLLERAAEHSDVAAADLALLRRMALTAEGAPREVPALVQIGERPAVWQLPDLLTPDECRHVAQCAAELLEPATVVDPRTGRNVANPVRTSDGAVIGPTRETLVVQAINRRLAAATGTDWRQGEALSVLRYRPGQQFRPHVDALPSTRNQRVRTVLVYLNDGFDGGATHFVGNGLRVTPRTGSAVVFDNVGADGKADPMTQHAGEPVRQGVKWLATRWIRARPFDVWTGPET